MVQPGLVPRWAVQSGSRLSQQPARRRTCSGRESSSRDPWNSSNRRSTTSGLSRSTAESWERRGAGMRLGREAGGLQPSMHLAWSAGWSAPRGQPAGALVWPLTRRALRVDAAALLEQLVAAAGHLQSMWRQGSTALGLLFGTHNLTSANSAHLVVRKTKVFSPIRTPWPPC